MFLWICVLVTIAAESVGILLGTTVNPIVSTLKNAKSTRELNPIHILNKTYYGNKYTVNTLLISTI